MTPEETQALVDHLDESRGAGPAGTLERRLAQDPEAAQEWHYLNVAVDAVRSAGLYATVSAVKEELEAERRSETTDTVSNQAPVIPAARGIVRQINRYGLRAAACIVIIIATSAIYEYVSVSSSSLYNRYYASYDLNTTRGESSERPVQKAYSARNWNAVIALADNAKEKDNQTEFLAGMADLELNKCNDAIAHFEQVIAANAQAGTDYYQDEAEYYLAISWLACKKVNLAMPILEKIKANPHHQYHEKVTKMSFFDLRLAQFKENK